MNLILIVLAVALAIGIIGAIGVRAIGGNIGMVDDWKASWRYYSSYGLLLIAMLPTLWNDAVSGGHLSTGDVPDEFSWVMRALALGTFFVLKIKQVQRPKLPDFGGETPPSA